MIITSDENHRFNLTPSGIESVQALKGRAGTGFNEPALDGLRWFAAATVLITHFSPTLGKFAEWGTYGVYLFFVLSGFLISSILLRARLHYDNGSPTGTELRKFFIRRIFRLWPSYYFVLIIAWLANIPHVRSSFAWQACFLSNYYILVLGGWPGIISHLWTLGVEQQFYFVWPFAILFCPRRFLPWMMICIIILAPLFRWAAIAAKICPPELVMMPLPSCFDLFGAGALLAWGRSRFPDNPVPPRLSLVPVAVLVCWIASEVILRATTGLPVWWGIPDASVQSLGFAGLLAYILESPSCLLARFLRWPLWVFLGGISYSIYLCHNFMHRLGPSLLRHVAGFNYFSTEWAHVIYLSCLSILVATIVYYLIEVPFRELGRRLAR